MLETDFDQCIFSRFNAFVPVACGFGKDHYPRGRWGRASGQTQQKNGKGYVAVHAGIELRRKVAELGKSVAPTFKPDMKIMALIFLTICWQSVLLTGQPEMVAVQGGAFAMGSPEGNADEKPVHRVVVSSFYLSETEITMADFKKFADATGYRTDAERSGGSYIWDSLGWHKQEKVNWRHDESGRIRLGAKFPV